MTPEQIEQLTSWARRLRSQGESSETRAAARAILMLAQEVERLQASATPPDHEPPPPAPPGAGHALADRLRGRSPLRRDDRAGEDTDTRREARGTTAVRSSFIAGARRARLSVERRRTLERRLRLGVAIAAGLVVLSLTYTAAARIAAPDVEAHGPPAHVGAEALESLAFWAKASPGTLPRLRWKLNGEDVTGRAAEAGDRLVLPARDLGDGEHTMTLSADGPFPGAGMSRTWRFVVDTKPPTLEIPSPTVPKGAPVRVAGTTEPGAAVRANGKPVRVEKGRFTLAYPAIPREPVQLVARDAAGNVARKQLRIGLAPRKPPVPMRGVHVTAHAWASPPHRRDILKLVDEGRINTVELDIKDEAGLVGFAADVPLGRRMGAVQDVYDLEEAVRLLHSKGVWVVGRLVAFRDPIHAQAAWRAGRRNEVVQTPDGGPYAGYGGFTNFADPAVRRYNVDVAVAAAKAGVDDILYDYIRRPDGPTSSMRFPGLRGKPEAAIVRFLRESAEALAPHDVFVGASVFGVAATRPHEVAQDIPTMAREVDYVAPMLYPSHWGPGEYDVPNPNGQPYEIVRRSLEDFKQQTKGTGARVVPWLQDFSLGVAYGPAEVRAQIRAARDAGMPEFLLWDPLVTYTADALDRGAPKVTAEARKRAASPAAPPPPAPAKAKAEKPAAPAVRANELGEVPVIMYHQIRADGGGDYDLTPAEFRRELEQLHRQGYRPIRAIDLVTGEIDLPAGKSPVVLTFDDSTKEQLAYGPGGKPKRDTAVGIMLDFARKHPDFKPAGTFYVNRDPFAGVAEGPALLRFLVEQGFELGNHTDDHIPFNQKSAAEVQASLVRGKRLITSAVPGARVRTMSLPLGVEPTPRSLGVRGSWNGESYRHEGVFLVGAGPAPSPFSKDWRPAAVPRIRTGPWSGGEPDFASGFWLDVLKENPERRYVSDGDPAKITFPRALAPKLAPRFRARANPY